MDPITLPLSSATVLSQLHGKSLKRLNLLRIVTSKDALGVICNGCKNLEQLCIDLGSELVRSMDMSLVL